MPTTMCIFMNPQFLILLLMFLSDGVQLIIMDMLKHLIITRITTGIAGTIRGMMQFVIKILDMQTKIPAFQSGFFDCSCTIIFFAFLQSVEIYPIHK